MDIEMRFSYPVANQVQQALDERLARLLATTNADAYDRALNSEAVRWTEQAKRIVAEALYPDLPEQSDPLTAAKAEAFRVDETVDDDGEPEWTNREGMPEFNGAFR